MKESNIPNQFETLIPCLATYFLGLSAQLLQKLAIKDSSRGKKEF